MPVRIIVGHPYSDIGKGWLTSSVAVHMENPLLFKVDPALMEKMPDGFGIPINGTYVTTDAATYTKRGHSFSPEQNFFIGKMIAQGIKKAPLQKGLLANDRTPIITHTDISAELASKISKQMKKAKTQDALIEIGGCPDDPEAMPIPAAIRMLDQEFGASVILLTKFDFNNEDGQHHIKTRGSTRAIETTMKAFWGLKLNSVFIRRAGLPKTIKDHELEAACQKVAFKSQIHPDRVVFLPDVNQPEELDQFTSFLKHSPNFSI